MSFPRSLAFLLLFVSLAAHALAGTVWYVKPPGSIGGSNNSGSSWGQPMTLDAALAAAAPGDEIRIAEGVYTPTVNAVPGSTDPRDRSFLINKSLAIIGGWLGNETGNTPPQGCPVNTVLDGNLDQPTSCDNSYHVVSIKGAPGARIAISRVQIIAGQASATACSGGAGGTGDMRNRGAGIYINSRSTVALSEVILDHNNGSWLGGGLYAGGCTLSVSQSIVSRNIVHDFSTGGGSGMYLACPSAKLVNVVFINNGNATSRGGGLYASGGDLELSNCVFDHNTTDFSPAATATGTGGAMYLEGDVSARLFNCTIGNNVASAVGAESIDLRAVTAAGECQFYNTIVYSQAPGAPHFLTAPGPISSSGAFKSSSCYLQIFPGQAAPIDTSAPLFPTHYNPTLTGAPPYGLTYEPGGLSLNVANTAVVVRTGGDPTWVPADALDIDADGDTVELLPLDREKGPRFTAGAVSMGAYEVAYPIILPGAGLGYYVNIPCGP